MSLSPLDRIRLSLARRHLDGVLITQPENRRYLSGFTAADHTINETSGVLLIPASGTPLLLTDGRYQLQAEQEAAGFEVRVYRRGLLLLLRRLLERLQIRRLGFESHYLLYATFVDLERMAKRRSLELVALEGLVERLRLVKSREELARIEAAVRLNEAVFEEVYQGMRTGQTEREVALAIEVAMRRQGADGPSFETIVASGPNGALPHAVPGERRLREGEPVIIDMGVRLAGYCSDMTRTVVLGTPDQQTVTLFRLVRRAQLAGLAALRAGVTGQNVDRAARRVIDQAGLGERFNHGLGHGVGLAVHEGPALSWRNRKKLAAGMVVTVEPGVYLPGWGGIRLENMAVVTEEGCRQLNRNTTFLDL